MTYELRLALTSGTLPEGYALVPNGEKVREYVGPVTGTYPALSLVACALNSNAEATKTQGWERGRQYYVHPVTQQKAA